MITFLKIAVECLLSCVLRLKCKAVYSICDTINKSMSCSTCPDRKNSIFAVIEGDALNLLDDEKQKFSYQKKDIIYKRGESPDGVYCIRRGLLKQTRNMQDQEERSQVVKLNGAGDMLGFFELLTNTKFSNTAVCIKEVDGCLISKNVFHKIFSESEALKDEFIKRCAEASLESEEQILRISSFTVSQRIAALLLHLNKRYGVKINGQSTIDLGLHRDELASLAGTVIESLVRHLSDLKAEKIIDTDGKKIIILDEKRLAKEAPVLA